MVVVCETRLSSSTGALAASSPSPRICVGALPAVRSQLLLESSLVLRLARFSMKPASPWAGSSAVPAIVSGPLSYWAVMKPSTAFFTVVH